jgi:hypothetical protein
MEPCKYCGELTEGKDAYEEHACEECLKFYVKHPSILHKMPDCWHLPKKGTGQPPPPQRKSS